MSRAYVYTLRLTAVAFGLLKVLRDGFGLTNAGPCRLEIHIGPHGTGDKLPL